VRLGNVQRNGIFKTNGYRREVSDFWPLSTYQDKLTVPRDDNELVWVESKNPVLGWVLKTDP